MSFEPGASDAPLFIAPNATVLGEGDPRLRGEYLVRGR